MSKKETSELIFTAIDVQTSEENVAVVVVLVTRKKSGRQLATFNVPIYNSGGSTLDELKTEAVDKAFRLDLRSLL